MEFFGYIVLVLGNLIYNKLIDIDHLFNVKVDDQSTTSGIKIEMDKDD